MQLNITLDTLRQIGTHTFFSERQPINILWQALSQCRPGWPDLPEPQCEPLGPRLGRQPAVRTGRLWRGLMSSIAAAMPVSQCRVSGLAPSRPVRPFCHDMSLN